MAEAQLSTIQAEAPKKQAKAKAYVSPGVSLIAGGVAGGVEAMCTYPFEFAKTRLQLRDSPSTSASSTTPKQMTRNPLILIRDIVRIEGISALYTGCTTLVVGTAFKASVRFLTFDSIKNALADEKGHLSKSSGILAGMMAGCVESVVAVTPTERIKTALIDDAKGPKRFRSTTHGIQLLIREQGLRRGLYQGLIPTTMKQSATSAVRMGTYNMLKESAKHYNIPLNGVTTFGIGSVAGIITVYATQPFDTIKTRVQGTQKATINDAVADVLREAGPKGLWKGSTMRLGRLFLSGGIVFSVYEQVVKALSPGN
ncbi:tricarboxylate transport protein, putative [Talaromyces stipitatus ATCC 10500]|uniref:Tricarboxylate transport protein, putative n=1 Tax=Talaromyces stipitatus (strain ATCC 10500 / CBS 375.48 / QM 6759 / NRRL 1006) TaxID=441959 RepID=B8LYK2_TALSN|nr:tricarboxylate transport protein, putative [Talaromyces stipitatus ATCC 10500]EED23360.1 tricarboxylate transport protein, putative [Talaromyces stipitatus ATCC 10500]